MMLPATCFLAIFSGILLAPARAEEAAALESQGSLLPPGTSLLGLPIHFAAGDLPCSDGQAVCGSKCIPFGKVCCSDGKYCDAGETCTADGLCSDAGPADAKCDPGTTACGSRCMPADAVCCKGGHFCDTGQICVEGGSCRKGVDDGEGACGAGKSVCGTGCMPLGAVCCSDGYCDAGHVCIAAGCCPFDKVCCSGGGYCGIGETCVEGNKCRKSGGGSDKSTTLSTPHTTTAVLEAASILPQTSDTARRATSRDDPSEPRVTRFDEFFLATPSGPAPTITSASAEVPRGAYVNHAALAAGLCVAVPLVI